MILDRLIITVIVASLLFLLWLGWHAYKANLVKKIQADTMLVGQPTLLYFTGQYCAVCKYQQTPIVDQIDTKFGDAIKIKQVDVSTNPNLAHQYKILTLPTTVILDQSGQVLDINYGLAKKEQLLSQLSELVDFKPYEILSNELQQI